MNVSVRWLNHRHAQGATAPEPTCLQNGCDPIFYLPSSNFQSARVVEWQTRTFEGRMPKGMRVQVPPRALFSFRLKQRDVFDTLLIGGGTSSSRPISCASG
jgi:hypothetical protein